MITVIKARTFQMYCFEAPRAKTFMSGFRCCKQGMWVNMPNVKRKEADIDATSRLLVLRLLFCVRAASS